MKILKLTYCFAMDTWLLIATKRGRAWKKLNELGTLLNSKVLEGATGNHDIQSRPLDVNIEIRDLNHVMIYLKL